MELCLKGALRALGIDYPKVHDVAPVFSEQVRRKVKAPVDAAILDRIEAVSLWLSQARTQAFYLERSYSDSDAAQASDDAAYVLAEVKQILKPPPENESSETEKRIT